MNAHDWKVGDRVLILGRLPGVVTGHWQGDVRNDEAVFVRPDGEQRALTVRPWHLDDER